MATICGPEGPRLHLMRGSLLVTGVGILISIVVTWALSRPTPEVEHTRRHFVALQRAVAAARDGKAARATTRGRVARLRAQARAADPRQRVALDAEADSVDARLSWGDLASVRAAVLSTPLVMVRRAVVPADVVPVFAASAGGCVACHLSVATSGFETYPAPFRTHPNLPGYVGAASSHPPSRVGCALCHQGDPAGTTFAGAGHSTLRSTGHEGRANTRTWTDPAAGNAMLPVGRTEAGCVACHAGEVYQPGAPTLNEALVTLERGGCDACHDLPGMDRTARRGPDLRRIGAKLSAEWVKAWLANPRAIKPATWMPQFWSADASSAEDHAAIDAVTAYLFATSDSYAPATASPPLGDDVRGKALVESVGCLGCHIVGDASRDTAGIRRTFGQPLQGIGSKVTLSWLYDWLREPSRYSPATRMPNLRLTGSEASDIAAYLATLTARAPALRDRSAGFDGEAYRAVIARYAPTTAAEPPGLQPLTGQPLRQAAGRAVIAALGCVNCHDIRGFDERRSGAPMARRAVWLEADVRTMHSTAASTPSGSGRLTSPDLGIGPAEGARLALALTAVAGRARPTHRISMPWHLVKSTGRTLVQERNCVGCHVIEGVGGDLVKLVAEPSLGPPLLTPEGSRVQPDWLRGFLHEPKTIRPWLSARMPTFGLRPDEVEQVGAYLRAVASPNPEPTAAPSGVTSAAGKELFELLKCQQCHVLGAIPRDQPTSNLAPDLRIARERLQPEWVLAWLRNPSAILPGTRMPTFWPDYPKSFYAPFGRDGVSQVRAIREHLLSVR